MTYYKPHKFSYRSPKMHRFERQNPVKTFKLLFSIFFNVTKMFDQLLNKVKEQVSNVSPELWKQHGSKIESLVVDGLLNIDEDKLINETEIRNVISKVYELLPTPVCLVLPREMIINKILEQKGPLLTKVSHAREKRKATQA